MKKEGREDEVLQLRRKREDGVLRLIFVTENDPNICIFKVAKICIFKDAKICIPKDASPRMKNWTRRPWGCRWGSESLPRTHEFHCLGFLEINEGIYFGTCLSILRTNYDLVDGHGLVVRRVDVQTIV